MKVTYLKNNTQHTFVLTEAEERYLKLNEEITGISPRDFIEHNIDFASEHDLHVVLLDAMKKNTAAINFALGAQSLEPNYDYTAVNTFLSSQTNKLKSHKDVLKMINDKIKNMTEDEKEELIEEWGL